MAEKSSPGTRQTDGKNLVWFGEIKRRLAKYINAYLYLPFFLLIILWWGGFKKKGGGEVSERVKRKRTTVEG
jgi:hypothetical protein